MINDDASRSAVLGDGFLSDEHARMLYAGSHIDPAVAAARGYRTIRSAAELERAINGSDNSTVVTKTLGPSYPNDPDDLTLHLQYGTGLNSTPIRSGRFLPDQLQLPALLVPVHWNGHVVGHRLRPDRPRLKDGKPIKYEQPSELPIHLDANPESWPYVLDAGYPLVITEGEKKADALRSAGAIAIALTGVWCWTNRNGKGAPSVPLKEWGDVPLHGRTVYLAFDSDATTNDNVRGAMTALTRFLRERGAIVRWLIPDGGTDGTKYGVDDYLAGGWTWQQYVDRFSSDPNPMRFRSLTEIARTYRPPRWLVREFLLDDAFSVVGGAEKSLKSWVMTALAVSVASGRPLFNEARFAVPEARRVLVLTGEGTSDLFYDRAEHMAGLHGFALNAVAEHIRVSDLIRTTSSKDFRAGVAWALTDFDPAVVIVDPAYVYVAADEAGAGNVFTMGKLLAELRELCGGRAVVVGHHFTKAGKDDLSLASLTQAGFREAADHWLLLAHAADPDLDRQRFKLRARCGARRGFGWDATFEVDLGPLDLDTAKHVGTPSWKVLAPESTQDEGTDWRRVVYQEIRDAPWTQTQNDLTYGPSGSRADHPSARRKALAWLKDSGIVYTKKLPGLNGERRADRFGPLWERDFDDVTEKLAEPSLPAGM